MKALSCMLLLLCSLAVSAEGERVYQYRPDGQRDWSANYYRVENGQAVPIRPDGQRDWNANIYRIERGQLVPGRPDGQRDWKLDTIRR